MVLDSDSELPIQCHQVLVVSNVKHEPFLNNSPSALRLRRGIGGRAAFFWWQFTLGGMTSGGSALAVISRVVADVWEKNVWDFQAKIGSSGSCHLLFISQGKSQFETYLGNAWKSQTSFYQTFATTRIRIQELHLWKRRKEGERTWCSVSPYVDSESSKLARILHPPRPASRCGGARLGVFGAHRNSPTSTWGCEFVRVRGSSLGCLVPGGMATWSWYNVTPWRTRGDP